jgi:ArsR family transcriptional regulator, lead/cadmium/zinc/bismuth-responsive transcriptional repressor
MARPKNSERLNWQTDPGCESRLVHPDAVLAARRAMPRPETIGRMSDLFGALGDPTRLRIVAALESRELCVRDLASALGMSESAVSHQLRALRSLRLVQFRREGRQNYYSLDDEHVSTLYAQGLEHVTHQERET